MRLRDNKKLYTIVGVVGYPPDLRVSPVRCAYALVRPARYVAGQSNLELEGSNLGLEQSNLDLDRSNLDNASHHYSMI